ncbi:unnamed protein product [Amoebophrya sp. A25]|nr:unnamed protein product [Amoebophrya sp. A25]|eukprot:GSA25T00015914001.1
MMSAANESDDMPLQYSDADILTDKLETSVRHGFVRKVMSLVGVQLLVTAAIAFPFVVYDASGFIQNNQVLITIAMLIPIALICYSMCDPSITREYPKNYCFLAAITLAFGLIVGVTCSMYTTSSVLMAAGLTGGITISLVAFACQTSYDFTGFGPYLTPLPSQPVCDALLFDVYKFDHDVSAWVPFTTDGGGIQWTFGAAVLLLHRFRCPADRRREASPTPFRFGRILFRCSQPLHGHHQPVSALAAHLRRAALSRTMALPHLWKNRRRMGQ